jgi:hypothetical protein
MLIFYALVLCALYIRDRERFRRPLFLYLLATAAAALLFIVPNKLNWRSSTPYRDSLFTLASFEQSSGRDVVWKIALHAIQAHPLAGLGFGQYPAVWQDFIPSTHIDPATLGFLRFDLPLFNDFLQKTAESGVPAGLLFLSTYVFFSLFTLWAAWRSREQSLLPVTAALICSATVLNGFVDYPFCRAETVLVFSIAASVVLREFPSPLRRSPSCRRQLRGAAATIALLSCSFLFFFLTVGLTSRAVWVYTHDVRFLSAANRYWPWDIQWAHQHLLSALESGNEDLAREMLARRLRSWPHDPEGYLMKAIYAEHCGNDDAAIAAYRRAVRLVENGGCYQTGYIFYKDFLNRRSAEPGLPRLTHEELGYCF